MVLEEIESAKKKLPSFLETTRNSTWHATFENDGDANDRG